MYPKATNREVCSIMTIGTRTFCYLDDSNGLCDDLSSSSANNGPLLAIRETVVDSSTSDDEHMRNDDNSINAGDDSVRPTCEVGITLVDAVRGSVTIGQFADDVLKSRLNTLLTTFSPSEVCI